MAADKGKKMKLSEKGAAEDNSSEQIDGELVHSIEKLQEVQDELERINEEASDKVLELEQKYIVKRKPIYDRRNEVIKAIPDFWLTAFLSHPSLSGLLTEEDQKIFKYLSSLEVEDAKDVKSGFSITFHFNPNPYFEDAKLTKSYTFLDEGTTKVTATSIKWKEGMGKANGSTQKKKGNKRPLSEESFFQWFKDDDDGLDAITDDIAELIKEDLWGNPLTYFNNEELDSEGEGAEGNPGSEDNDEEDDDEEAGDEDEDEDEEEEEDDEEDEE